MAWFEPALRSLPGNPFVIGSLAGDGGGFAEAIAGRWRAAGGMGLDRLEIVVTSALTLAVLLSIDTLKTCVVLDTLTRSRHDSNREIVGQGVGNIVSAVAGGIPGAGTMAKPPSINPERRLVAPLETFTRVAPMMALLVFGGLIAWMPVASLVAILIVIGARMIDRHSLGFLKSRATVLDFAIIFVVIVVALTVSLIAASGVGVGLAVLLFMREQIGGTIVRRKSYGDATFSKQVRLHDEMAILEREGHQAVIVELQGSLFFGTADQLYRALAPEMGACRYIILDMRRVQSVDVTAAHVLEQIKDQLAEREGFLIFSQLPSRVPSGLDMQR
ncbi:MAG: SulP family inorganic anion transporter, partial [Methylomagnum sp.]